MRLRWGGVVSCPTIPPFEAVVEVDGVEVTVLFPEFVQVGSIITLAQEGRRFVPLVTEKATFGPAWAQVLTKGEPATALADSRGNSWSLIHTAPAAPHAPPSGAYLTLFRTPGAAGLAGSTTFIVSGGTLLGPVRTGELLAYGGDVAATVTATHTGGISLSIAIPADPGGMYAIGSVAVAGQQDFSGGLSSVPSGTTVDIRDQMTPYAASTTWDHYRLWRLITQNVVPLAGNYLQYAVGAAGRPVVGAVSIIATE